MNYLFLDTNVLIHFQDFEQINWNDILNTNDQTTIVIAPIVIDELDKHKYNKATKISNRAKRILPRIENLIDDPSQCKYGFEYISNRPLDAIFEKSQLDKREQDDCLLASIIQFSSSINLREDSVFFVTNDTGPRLKSKSLGIKALNAPLEFLLPAERDSLETENKKLQKEINEIKSSRPVVKLFFEEQKTLLSRKTPEAILDAKSYKESKISELRKKFPLLEENKIDPSKSRSILYAHHSYLSNDQITSYNKELYEFYSEYEMKILELYARDYFNSKSIKLDLLLLNSGTSPAIDIDVTLFSDKNFQFFPKNERPKNPKLPTPPYKPQSYLDFSWSKGLNLDIDSALYRVRPSSSTDAAVVVSKDRFSVSISYKNLKHNQSIKLDSIYASFLKREEVKSFNIQYNLKIANLPHMVEDTLNVKIE